MTPFQIPIKSGSFEVPPPLTIVAKESIENISSRGSSFRMLIFLALL
jgi:hypothetical protein